MLLLRLSLANDTIDIGLGPLNIFLDGVLTTDLHYEICM
jgi:hypothetical protein